jgi:hypothetical protein
MRITATELAREAAATGFQTEPLEKVILLLELLEATRSHPFLKDRVALKGGTALNLFRFAVPRLSVDIDLNYIGAVSLDGMLAERPKIEQALQAVCGRVGVQPRRVPSDHAGGKWRLSSSSPPANWRRCSRELPVAICSTQASCYMSGASTPPSSGSRSSSMEA